jgi:hypothetical protein
MSQAKSTVIGAGIATDIQIIRDRIVGKAEQFFVNRRQQAQQDYRVEVMPIRRNQLENVLRLASESKSVREVVSFIKYQIGREEKPGQGWRNGNFGYILIDDMNTIANLDPRVPPYQSIRLFLGYLVRAFVYEESIEGPLKEMASQFFDRRRNQARDDRSVVPVKADQLTQLFQQARNAASTDKVTEWIQQQVNSYDTWHNADFGKELIALIENAAQQGWNDEDKITRARLLIGAIIREGMSILGHRRRGGEEK